jgi:hypothetical protein
MINTDLLTRTLDFIEKHPEQWNQASYRSCFVGTAATISGLEWAPDEASDRQSHDVLLPGGRSHVSWWAEAVLGLSRTQYLRLILYRNTIDDLRRLVSDFIAQAISEDLIQQMAAADLHESQSTVVPV